MLGKIHDIGSGMVPKHLLVGSPRMKTGVTDGVETFYVRHVSGGISECTFLSGEQERDSFQGEDVDVIWCDEELKDLSKYTECIARLRNPIKPGIIYNTFTPLKGLSGLALSFLPGGKCPDNGKQEKYPSRYTCQTSIYDVPHATEEFIKNVKTRYPEHELNARLHGIPGLGSGAIYPFSIESIVCDDFEIPEWWPKAYGMDTKWMRTAVVWGAQNPDTKQFYVYSEHVMGEALPIIHASAIKDRGAWMVGAVDTAVLEKSNLDGKTLLEVYEKEGLRLEIADKSVETAIFMIRQMFATGQLKIFKSCKKILEEYGMYRRDEKGAIVKEMDDLMDAMRYLIFNFSKIASCAEEYEDIGNNRDLSSDDRDDVTGY